LADLKASGKALKRQAKLLPHSLSPNQLGNIFFNQINKIRI